MGIKSAILAVPGRFLSAKSKKNPKKWGKLGIARRGTRGGWVKNPTWTVEGAVPYKITQSERSFEILYSAEKMQQPLDPPKNLLY